ncbi:hypothetical protein H0X32_02070 [Patescibacteria group bacterium]|nr:hypothetical protein [Patescibacteria group bacterium]
MPPARSARFASRPGDVKKRKPIPQRSAAVPVRSIRRERVAQGRDREPLKNRRRRARNRTFITMLAFIVLVFAAGFTCLWLPAFRIQRVVAAGPDAEQIKVSVPPILTGRYKYIFPRDSIFFFPEADIRTYILQEYPDISAISISRTSFDSIAIDSIPRESAFIWCGSTYDAHEPVIVTPTSSTTGSAPTSTSTLPTCYDADAQGYIFASLPEDPSLAETLHIYGPLTASSTANGTILGQQIAQARFIPHTLTFVKAIKSLGVSVGALAIRGDEADLYTQGKTRITYVLGQEASAAALAQSAFPTLNLNNGSLSYVDLRFADKVYFKNVGQDVASSTVSTH